MARIRRTKKSLGPLFVGTTMSGAMYEEVVTRAAEGYNPILEAVRLEAVLRVVPWYPAVSLVKRKVLEVDVVVKEVNGKHVTFWMTLDLHGPDPDVGLCVKSIAEWLLPDSGITVEKGALVGEIFLSEEPYRVPTLHNGAMYFLNNEKEAALAFLAQDSAVHR